jgi:ribosome maturation factor RimP
MNRQDIPQKVEQLILPILEREQIEIVDVEFKPERGKRWVLRIYIDKPGGVTIDDCADVSHKIEDVIEVKELVPHSYFLEISSPGLDRPLTREKDFERFSGRIGRIQTMESMEGRRNFMGMILGCREGIVEIKEADGTIQRVPLAKIKKARLKIEV